MPSRAVQLPTAPHVKGSVIPTPHRLTELVTMVTRTRDTQSTGLHAEPAAWIWRRRRRAPACRRRRPVGWRPRCTGSALVLHWLCTETALVVHGQLAFFRMEFRHAEHSARQPGPQ